MFYTLDTDMFFFAQQVSKIQVTFIIYIDLISILRPKTVSCVMQGTTFRSLINSFLDRIEKLRLNQFLSKVVSQCYSVTQAKQKQKLPLR